MIEAVAVALGETRRARRARPTFLVWRELFGAANEVGELDATVVFGVGCGHRACLGPAEHAVVGRRRERRADRACKE